MISEIKHPDYTSCIDDWVKWRRTYESGRPFVRAYLKKFSAREDTVDFNNRSEITYVPAFAKAAVNDIKNAIFQRIADVTRINGPKSYNEAVEGRGFGVDLRGSSMNAYVGKHILPELLTMKRVGVFVDRQPIQARATLADPVGQPYVYLYRAEDIRSWVPSDNGKPWEFKSLLLAERKFKVVDGLPDSEIIETYRRFDLIQGRVVVRTYDTKGEPTTTGSLNLPAIPFVMFELSDSLLRDVCDYQIALMNLASSDVTYCLLANFPFYTEQRDPNSANSHLKRSQQAGDTDKEEGSTDDEIRAGSTHGRSYPRGMERPGFIAPPTDPLKASMEKQREMKDEIRLLVNLSLGNVKPKMASAESKGMDERGLEAGLSAIGLELQHGERLIAKYWAAYESSQAVADVNYPKRYSLKNDSEILAEAKDLQELKMTSPSDTFKREIGKQIATLTLSGKVHQEKLDAIHSEIDKAEILLTDPDVVIPAVENGILDNEGAAMSLGIPIERVEKAKQDHADRLARIAESQALANPDARGVSDAAADPAGGKKEKQAAEELGGAKKRGNGK